MGRAIGKQSKQVPELDFFLDTMQDEVDRVEKLFEKIEILAEDKED
ncbi:MAG: ribosome-binding factor A [Flammeovirgaceae bacterium]